MDMENLKLDEKYSIINRTMERAKSENFKLRIDRIKEKLITANDYHFSNENIQEDLLLLDKVKNFIDNI